MPPVDVSTIQETQVTTMLLSRVVKVNYSFLYSVLIFITSCGYSLITEHKIEDKDYMCLIHNCTPSTQHRVQHVVGT